MQIIDARPALHHGYVRLLSVALRVVTLVSKFLLLFFLARFLQPAEVGLYGLLVATISYGLYLVGFDFYTFSSREIIQQSPEHWGGMLKNQGALTLVLYAIFVPVLVLLFTFGILPWTTATWFFALLLLEHINQELIRLLVAISEPLLAGCCLFLRSGAWSLAITALMYEEPQFRGLESVLSGWTIGGVAAAVLAVVHLRQRGLGGWQSRIDWGWIEKGVHVALPLLAATLAVRGLFTLDRYWVESLLGLEVLGAYVLYMGIASAMIAFLEAGVFAFIYPGLIRSYQNGETDKYHRELKFLAIQTVGISIAYSVVAIVLAEPLLDWLGRPIYHVHRGIFPWILLAVFLYAVSMVPHYALYAQKCDRPLIQSHLAGLAVFLITAWCLSRYWPQLAVPLGLCIAFSLILIWKTGVYFKLSCIDKN